MPAKQFTGEAVELQVNADTSLRELREMLEHVDAEAWAGISNVRFRGEPGRRRGTTRKFLVIERKAG